MFNSRTTKVWNAAQNQLKNDPSFMQKLKAVPRLIKAIQTNQYHRNIINLLLPVLGLIYVISPIDLITDFIPIIGWLDDLAVLGLIFNKFSTEMNLFLNWENSKSNSRIIDVEAL